MQVEPPAASRTSVRPRNQPSIGVSSWQLLMIVLFISLGVLFAATLLVYVLARVDNTVWWSSRATPTPPLGLVASTALLIGVSYALHRGMVHVRANRLESLERSLKLAGVLAVGFLCAQCLNWVYLMHTEFGAGVRGMYVLSFFFLTGLHAAHVLGGFVPLGVVMARTRRHEYTSSRHDGVKYCVQYWHFLLGVWLVLFTTIFVVH
jgi:cytochrome c oxidase subunit III